jgi:hypothetical protein
MQHSKLRPRGVNCTHWRATHPNRQVSTTGTYLIGQGSPYGHLYAVAQCSVQLGGLGCLDGLVSTGEQEALHTNARQRVSSTQPQLRPHAKQNTRTLPQHKHIAMWPQPSAVGHQQTPYHAAHQGPTRHVHPTQANTPVAEPRPEAAACRLPLRV